VADKVRALNLGAVDYMGKPFQALELLQRTERALQLANTQRELSRSVSALRKAGNDPETGLFDRSGMLHRLEQELSRAQRYTRPLSVAVLRPGRSIGDRVRAAAAMVRQKVRAPDVVGHLGEGVLAVMLPETSEEAARQIFSRLLPELLDELSV